MDIIDSEIGDLSKPTVCVEEALKLMKETILKNQDTIETEEVNIKNAFGRILSKAATCRRSVPPLAVATKCGYAVTVDKEASERKEKDEVSCNNAHAQRTRNIK